MTNEIFNIFATIGIGLTFLTSLLAVIVSVISLQSTKKSADRAGYLSTITSGREKWQFALRESASGYFTQIARLCDEQEHSDLSLIYNELVKYHFEIILLIFKQDIKLHDTMEAIREIASKIVAVNNVIITNGKSMDKEELNKLQDKICEMRFFIVENHRDAVFDEVQRLVEEQWRRQQGEAVGNK